MKMKKVLIVLTLMLTLGMSVQAASQKHRHTPRGTELVDTTKHNSGVDAFSDTTSIDSAYSMPVDEDWDSEDPIEKVSVRCWRACSRTLSFSQVW